MYQSLFQDEYREAYAQAENILGSKIESVDFPEYRGMTFEEFWHALPRKLEYFDYEEELTNDIANHKKLWIKKSTGLGVTEWINRWVAWNCLKDDEWKNKQIDVSAIFITGARQELTNQIIGRIKGLFDYDFKTKESVIILNGCRIEAFPTNNLAASRGLNPRIVVDDECDFFPSRYQDECRTVSERYIAKGNANIVMISTPNLPGGLFERMEEEYDKLTPEERKDFYYMKHMNYKRGLGKVFRYEDIEIAKQSPSFEREYNLQYGYGSGDVYDIPSLEKSIQEYDIVYLGGQAGTYADPGWGSSKFGKVSGEIRDGIIHVMEAEEYTRDSPSRMLGVIEDSWKLHQQNCKVDAANPGFIKDLRERNIPAVGLSFGEQVVEVEGNNTTTTLKKKLPVHASMMVKRGLVRIHPQFKKLISQMRAVNFDKMGGIDKSEVPFDLVDAFNMMLWDLKQFDYTHFDVMDNKIVKTNTEPVKKKTGISLNTEVVE